MACEHRFGAHRGLVLIAAALPAVEAAALVSAGLADSAALAVHASAPPPFGTFHDLRWLVAYHPSAAVFAAEAVGLVALRGAVIAALVVAAWPDRAARPSLLAASRRGAAFAFGAALVLAPWTALLFGAAALPLSWLFLAGLPPAVILALLIHRGAVAGQWWRLPTPRTTAWTALAFVVLTVGGAATAVVPPGAAWVVAGLVGVVNARVWFGVVHDLNCADRGRDGFPLVPGFVAVFLALVVGVAALVFGRSPPAGPANVDDEGPRPVLVARGFGSSWDGRDTDVLGPPFDDVRFSYRGLSSDGEPLPYAAAATHQALPELARLMARQVEALHRRTGRPVSIVAVSEGSLVARVYLAAAPSAPVERVVFSSALLRPAQVYYPPTGRDGWGAASGMLLDGITRLISSISKFDVRPGAPFARSVVDHAPLLRGLMTCPPRGDAALLLPLADAVVTPLDVAEAAAVVPAVHAGILRENSPRTTVVARLLNGEPPPAGRASPLMSTVVRAVAAPWQVPPVPLGLPPRWASIPGGVGVGSGCAAAERGVAAWVGSLRG